MPKRVDDWVRQADKDLKHAKNALEVGDFEWSCFASQQSAEKALKAVYEEMNMAVKGHSILGLLKGLQQFHAVSETFLSFGRMLSRYYIEARYPNGFPEGAPLDYFDKKMAKEAIDAAKKLLKWSRVIISKRK